jgi:beta-galactosidase
LSSGARATLWTERLRLTAAEAVDSYADGPLAGVPAVTRNAFGAGRSWYLATQLDPPDLRDVFRRAMRDAGVTAAGPENDGSIEVVRRSGACRRYVFVVNHGPKDVEHPITGHDLVTGDRVDGVLRVPAGSVGIVREEPAP